MPGTWPEIAGKLPEIVGDKLEIVGSAGEWPDDVQTIPGGPSCVSKPPAGRWYFRNVDGPKTGVCSHGKSDHAWAAEVFKQF